MSNQAEKPVRNVTPEQKKIMLDFMEKHPDFAAGRVHAEQGSQCFNRLWDNLAKLLHKVPNGSIKTITQWKDVWGRMRSNSKAYALSNGKPKCNRTGGGGCSDEEEQNVPTGYTTEDDFVDRVMKLQGWHTVFGIGVVDELDNSSDDDQSKPVSQSHPSQCEKKLWKYMGDKDVEALHQMQRSVSKLSQAIQRLTEATATLQTAFIKVTGLR
ncbi:Tubby-like F-box protein 10 [Frankliniella fusca]|uniref:Regulatory protein zeste n=1 Tax=Frankliniella fusca TaxID=407009 RepID=A0AAE1L8Y2_9NEOP|nr:Tubby-like F-box protein 10 [Frankliniella fusca]